MCFEVQISDYSCYFQQQVLLKANKHVKAANGLLSGKTSLDALGWRKRRCNFVGFSKPYPKVNVGESVCGKLNLESYIL